MNPRIKYHKKIPLTIQLLQNKTVKFSVNFQFKVFVKLKNIISVTKA